MSVATRFFFLLLTLISVIGCQQPPDYSDTPVIEFVSIEKVVNDLGPGLAQEDSIIITLRFQDGDGDLGISAEAANEEPYATEEYGNETIIPADTVITPADTFFVGDEIRVEPADTIITPEEIVYDHVNFYINEYKKVNGEFVRVEVDGVKGGRFLPLYDTSRKGTIDGELENTIIWNHGSISLGGVIGLADTVKFEVFILDRGLRRSNTITTDEIVVLQPTQ